MIKCEQCMVRQLNAMKTLTKMELKKVSESKIKQNYEKGDVIFKEGELLNGVYCIKSGVCKLIKLSSNGKDHTVKLMGLGELLGQRSVITNEHTNLSAVALNDVELCFIPKDQIIDSVYSNKEFSMQLLQQFAKDLRVAEDDIIDMAQKSVRQRMANVLVYIHNSFGVDKEGLLNIVLSREDYANIVGTATESAIRILSQFKKEGLITTNGKSIRITNVEGLKRVD